MILHLVGGRDDGTTIDTDDPGTWTGNDLAVPLPEVIEMHTARPNRCVYRLVKADQDECTYQLDPALTAEYRTRAR